jgi:hypothetical protein
MQESPPKDASEEQIQPSIEILELATNITSKPEDSELQVIQVTNLSGETVQTVKAKDMADLLYSNQ